MGRRTVLILGSIFLLGVFANCGGGGGGSDSDRTGRAVVPLANTDEIAVVDLATGDILSTVTSSIEVGEVILDPAGTTAFILSYEEETLFEYNISGDNLIYSQIHDIYISTYDYMYPYTGVWANDSLAIITDYNQFILYNPDTSAAAYSYLYDDSHYLYDITSNSAGTRLFMVDYTNDMIIGVDNNAAVLESVFYADVARGISDTADGPSVLTLSPDGTRLYVANYSSDDMVIFSVNMASGALSYLKEVPFPTDMDLYNTRGMIVTSDGNEVWIACDDSSTIGVYNTVTEAITVIELDSPNLQAAPAELAFGPDGDYVYVLGSGQWLHNKTGTDNLYVIDVSTKTVVDTLPVPSASSPATTSQPCGIAIF